jgi:hypothetical protein
MCLIFIDRLCSQDIASQLKFCSLFPIQMQHSDAVTSKNKGRLFLLQIAESKRQTSSSNKNPENISERVAFGTK